MHRPCSRSRTSQVFVLSGADEVLEELEDHQMQLQSMAGMGKFVDFFREEVTRTPHVLDQASLKLSNSPHADVPENLPGNAKPRCDLGYCA